MKKYLFLAGATVFGLCSAASAAINCQTLPSCDELGYEWTAEACSGQKTLKCPFNQNALYCTNPRQPDNCQVGSVLYEDKKCYASAPSGQNPIGVVFDTSKRLAVALTPAQGYKKWGAYGIDISGLENCSSGNFASCGTDGQANTDKIIAAIGSDTTTAAGWCKSLGYFLPSAGELQTLSNNKTKVNEGLSTLPNPDTILIDDSGYYWSSTESDTSNALTLSLSCNSSNCISYGGKAGSYVTDKTRCVLAY